MADEKPEIQGAPTGDAGAAGLDEAAATPASDGPAGEGSDPRESVAAGDGPLVSRLEGELSDLKDRLLRAAAEMENLRRRTEREVADAKQYAVSAFAREVLTVGDNLRRAIEAVPAEVRSAAEGALTTLLDGVEMTERELVKALSKHGVRRVDPQGERFDPHVHQAMFEVDNPDVPSGTIVQVFQPGYLIGERVLRPALVGVSKGGPKAPRPEARPAEGADAADGGGEGTG